MLTILPDPRLEHVAARVLRETKDAGEVDVDQRLPVFFRIFGGRRAANDAGVVDQNVDGAEVTDGFFHQARADGGIAHVAGEGHGSCADRFDFLLRGFRRRAGAMNGDVGAGLGKRYGDGSAKAARGAGDESDFAVEIEFVENHGFRDQESCVCNAVPKPLCLFHYVRRRWKPSQFARQCAARAGFASRGIGAGEKPRSMAINAGLEEAKRVRHSRVPWGRAGHLRRVVGNDDAVEAVLM